MQAAEAIQGLLRSYSQLHTLKRVPFFVPYIALTATMVHVTKWISSQQGSSQRAASSTSSIASRSQPDLKVTEAISEGIRDQTVMAPNNGLAEKALDILRDLGRRWDISVDTDRGIYQLDFDPLAVPKTSSLNSYAFAQTPEDVRWATSTNIAISPSLTTNETKLQSHEQQAALAGSPIPLAAPIHRYLITLAGIEPEEAGFTLL